MTTTTKALAAATLALALTGVLAACSDDTPPETTSPTPTTSASPSPSPTKSVDPAEQLKQENIDDAKAALTEYYEALGEVANDAYDNWERLQKYWGNPDVAQPLAELYEGEREAGNYTEGETKIASMKVTKYVADPSESGAEQVSIRACIDTTGTTAFNKDGSKAKDGVDRFTVDYTMSHQGLDNPWTISKREADVEKTC
jgi:hypothetical protein